MIMKDSCLRSQSYEFESNSQLLVRIGFVWLVVWGHKVTNLKATHNKNVTQILPEKLFEVTKLRIWKQLTTSMLICSCALLLFEVTKLRIWKQLTTLLPFMIGRCLLFEITKLRIWKQLTTPLISYRLRGMLFEIKKLQIWKQLTTVGWSRRGKP